MNRISIKSLFVGIGKAIKESMLNLILILIYYIGIGITIFLYFFFMRKYKSLYRKRTYWDEVEKKSLSMDDCFKQI